MLVKSDIVDKNAEWTVCMEELRHTFSVSCIGLDKMSASLGRKLLSQFDIEVAKCNAHSVTHETRYDGSAYAGRATRDKCMLDLVKRHV